MPAGCAHPPQGGCSLCLPAWSGKRLKVQHASRRPRRTGLQGAGWRPSWHPPSWACPPVLPGGAPPPSRPPRTCRWRRRSAWSRPTWRRRRPRAAPSTRLWTQTATYRSRRTAPTTPAACPSSAGWGPGSRRTRCAQFQPPQPPPPTAHTADTPPTGSPPAAHRQSHSNHRRRRCRCPPRHHASGDAACQSPKPAWQCQPPRPGLCLRQPACGVTTDGMHAHPVTSPHPGGWLGACGGARPRRPQQLHCAHTAASTPGGDRLDTHRSVW